MGNIITSAYDGETLTVDEMLKDPTWIPQRVIKALDGAFLEDLIFRNGGGNDGVVAFRQAASPYLVDDAEEVAEYGEIPVTGLGDGKVRSIIGHKVALGVRVSYEMRHENKVDQVTRQTVALQNTMIRSGVKASIAAFEAADVPTETATNPWDGSTSTVVDDVHDAIEAVQSATVDGDPDSPFGYAPTVIALHPATLTKITRQEAVQKFYRGDLASANPVYRGVQPITLFGLTVATSRFLDPDKVIICETGAVGFRSDTYPLQMTPVYEEGGASGSGGPNMSWRADAFRKRILAVDNPKAAIILTGIVTP